jgi:two-component system phosphate regulon sensor histidine kinase PhoR
MNIIQNSLEHTLSGGSIAIHINKINNNAIIKITDTGEGIDEKHLPFIFDRFYKADSARNNSKIGSGLGLSIVKEIVDNYYGKVTVESSLGKGTSIIVTFPLIS